MQKLSQSSAQPSILTQTLLSTPIIQIFPFKIFEIHAHHDDTSIFTILVFHYNTSKAKPSSSLLSLSLPLCWEAEHLWGHIFIHIDLPRWPSRREKMNRTKSLIPFPRRLWTMPILWIVSLRSPFFKDAPFVLCTNRFRTHNRGTPDLLEFKKNQPINIILIKYLHPKCYLISCYIIAPRAKEIIIYHNKNTGFHSLVSRWCAPSPWTEPNQINENDVLSSSYSKITKKNAIVKDLSHNVNCRQQQNLTYGEALALEAVHYSWRRVAIDKTTEPWMLQLGDLEINFTEAVIHLVELTLIKTK